MRQVARVRRPPQRDSAGRARPADQATRDRLLRLPHLGHRDLAALQRAVGNQAVQRMLRTERASPATAGDGKISDLEYEALKQRHGAYLVDTAIEILDPVMLRVSAAVTKSAVEAKIQILRTNPKLAYTPVIARLAPGLLSVDWTLLVWTRSGANCHSYALNDDCLSDDEGAAPDPAEYRAFRKGDSGKVYAFFWKGDQLAHSGVRNGDSVFQKLPWLPLFSCSPEATAKALGYTDWGYFVKAPPVKQAKASQARLEAARKARPENT